ncbi:MAG: molybdate ABC transporter substrate-binding protein [Xanthobacteraceae bacterium]|jgi:molybdate transport system substrate-binding protein
MRDGWIIFVIFGVLVCLLLWRVATQWKVKSTEAENLRVSVVIFGVVALVLVVLQCVRQASPIAAHSQDKTITVFAAASMKNALDDVNETFTTRTGIKVVTSYDASSALMKQIEGGAPADAFVSANLKWMDYGVEKKVINESTRFNLLGNVLVLIAGKDSKIDHVDMEPGFDLAKLAGDGRIATGDKEVPVGLYAKAALEKLGVWPSVGSKMAMTVNVRAALAYVVRGEAPLSIVYATDAKIEPGVKVVGVFPDNSHDPIIYPVAATENAKSETIQYLAFLQSAAAKSIFDGYGFSVLAKPTS